MFKRAVIGLFILIGSLLSRLSVVHAVSNAPLNLTTSASIDLVAKPGQTVAAELKVKNNAAESENLVVGLKKFQVARGKTDPDLVDRQSGDDYFDWVSFSQTKIKADPDVWNTVTMTVKVPPSAAFGYYYAVTFARAENPSPVPGKNTIYGEVANLVLLDVETHNTKRELQVEEFKAERLIYEFLPTTFNVKIKNIGNIHSSAHGNIFIEHRGKKNIGNVEINKTNSLVLPGSSRVFSASWNDGFPVYVNKSDNPQAGQRLKWDFTQVPKFRFGKYTAKLFMVYDDGHRDIPIEGTLTFWVIPWRLIGALILLFVFTPIGFYATIHKVWKISHKKRH